MKVNFLQLLHESHKIDELIDTEVATLASSALRSKPSADIWSIIEVIDHLNKTFELYIPRLEKAYGEASDRHEVCDEVTIRSSRALMINSVAPKNGKRPFKMKTFSFFEPKVSDKEVQEILQQYRNYRDTFNEILKDARKKDVDRVSIQSALKYLSFRVPEALKFVLSHEQRHILQLRGVMEAVLEEV